MCTLHCTQEAIEIDVKKYYNVDIYLPVGLTHDHLHNECLSACIWIGNNHCDYASSSVCFQCSISLVSYSAAVLYQMGEATEGVVLGVVGTQHPLKLYAIIRQRGEHLCDLATPATATGTH